MIWSRPPMHLSPHPDFPKSRGASAKGPPQLKQPLSRHVGAPFYSTLSRPVPSRGRCPTGVCG